MQTVCYLYFVVGSVDVLLEAMWTGYGVRETESAIVCHHKVLSDAHLSSVPPVFAEGAKVAGVETTTAGGGGVEGVRNHTVYIFILFYLPTDFEPS